MQTHTYLTDTTPGSGAHRAPRSWLRTDAPTLSLDGLWRFRLLSGAPGTPGAEGVLPAGESAEAVADNDFDDSSWDTIPVPAHWVLEGDGAYGHPIYTNTRLPFPLDPPFVPDANPTGDYRRSFEIPDSWAGAHDVALRFEGVESRYKVWVNGVEVGVASGSRLAQEFDVADLLRPGTNLIVVRVHQWSAASYLEDQDQWWLPGIFRSVTLQVRPPGGIEDLWLHADYHDPAGTLEVEVRGASFPVRLVVAELGIEKVWQTAADVGAIEIPHVEPWSAEHPRLYDAVVSNQVETITLRIGFRSVRIEGDRFLVNDRRVVFHGVNRHEAHPDRGRVFDEEFARADLAQMKQFNVNAIRTSHYPPHPRLLELADELGFWVILENDLETHAFHKPGDPREWLGNPSDDADWRDAYLNRIERTVERDKNHPSIVLWSLGNEAGTGANLAQMADWVRLRDPGRPVHYEGDHAGAYTDVYSRMYSTIPETRAIGQDDDASVLLNCSAAESARQRSKPFLLCEYAHAMGNGPGAIDQYEDLVDRFPRLHGGFVWEWRDHGLRTRTPDGTEYFAYGGDFGEPVHDSNFVMDGMVLSDGTPSPSLHEWKHVVAPVRFHLSATSVAVENHHQFIDLSGFLVRWTRTVHGYVIERGELTLPSPVDAGSFATVPLPVFTPAPATPVGEDWLTVEAVLASDVAWAAAGHVVATAQHRLSSPVLAHPGQRQADTVPEPSLVCFHGGRLAALAGLPVSGPLAELWRAPTDNDDGGSVTGGFGSYDSGDPWANNGLGVPAPSSSELWRRVGLDRIIGRTEAVAQGGARRRLRYSAADARESLLVDERWTDEVGSALLTVSLIPAGSWRIHWPRVGVRFALPATVDHAEWFGAGERESYPDSRRSAHVGRYKSHLPGLVVDYARPQESGHHSEFRELILSEGGSAWLKIEAIPDGLGRLPGFTLRRHTTAEVAAAGHPHDLPESDRVYLWLDAAQHGLGSRACGPDVWPDHILRPEARTITLRLTSLR